MDKLGSKRQLILAGILTLAWIIVYFALPFTGLEAEGKMVLVVFLWALSMWIVRPIPEYMVGIIAATVLMLFGNVGLGKVTANFASAPYWVVFFASLMGGMLTVTGLGERLAYNILLKMGTSHLKVSYASCLATILLSSCTPSGTARGAIIANLTDGICNSMGYKAGEYRGDHGLMLANLYTNANCTWIFLTAGGATLIGTGILQEMTGQSPGWVSYLIAGSLPALIYFAVVPFICYKLFPVDKTAPAPNLEFVREKLNSMGKMSMPEKKGAIIVAVTFLLWITADITGINSNHTAFLLGLALILPGISPVKFDELQHLIPWKMLLFCGFALSLASLVNSTGGFNWLIDTLFVSTAFFESLSFTGLVAIMLPIIAFSHIIFNGYDSMTTIMVPIAITIALAKGFDPYTIGLITIMACVTCGFFLPFNMAPNMLFLSTGRYTVGQQAKGGVVFAAITCVLFFFCLFVWWPLVGLI